MCCCVLCAVGLVHLCGCLKGCTPAAAAAAMLALQFDKPMRQYDWGHLRPDGSIERIPAAQIPQEVPH